MTIAEKFYREWHSIKVSEKLNSDQYKIVRLLHQCLKKNNKPKLEIGKMIVNKKSLIEHCQILHQAVKAMDAIMGEKESFGRGKKVALVVNAINTSVHSIEHFELGVPLDKLGKTLPISYTRNKKTK